MLEDLYNELGWNSIIGRRQKLKLLFIHNIISSNVPHYLQVILSETVGSSCNHLLRSRHKAKVSKPDHYIIQIHFYNLLYMNAILLLITSKLAGSTHSFKRLIYIDDSKSSNFIHRKPLLNVTRVPNTKA